MRLIDFIDKYKILYDNQFGFRRKHSTAFALALLTEKITQSFEEGKFTIGVFLDFSKAFDTVDHGILFKKLEHYGIRGLALDFVKSYLRNRYQYVSINNINSKNEQITCGVPQGSILGPILFLLYINDISNVSSQLFTICFADDSNVFVCDNQMHRAIEILNNELTKLVVWLDVNKLSLNINKSNFIIFSRRPINDDCNIIIKGTSLERLYETKFLGVIIDDTLSWKSHTLYVKNKISKNLGLIYKAKKYVKPESLLTLYYTFIYPYLMYCLEIWGKTFMSYLDPIFKLQKRIVRLITGSKIYNENTLPMFKELKMLNLMELYYYKVILILYKVENNDLPVSILNFFTRNSDVHDHATRQSNRLHFSSLTYEYEKRTLVYNVIKVSNKIPTDFKFDVKYTTFKKTVKSYICLHGCNIFINSG